MLRREISSFSLKEASLNLLEKYSSNPSISSARRRLFRVEDPEIAGVTFMTGERGNIRFVSW